MKCFLMGMVCACALWPVSGSGKLISLKSDDEEINKICCLLS
jgi:hypothetical protein